jgi:hypothetical protein
MRAVLISLEQRFGQRSLSQSQRRFEVLILQKFSAKVAGLGVVMVP